MINKPAHWKIYSYSFLAMTDTSPCPLITTPGVFQEQTVCCVWPYEANWVVGQCQFTVVTPEQNGYKNILFHWQLIWILFNNSCRAKKTCFPACLLLSLMLQLSDVKLCSQPTVIELCCDVIGNCSWCSFFLFSCDCCDGCLMQQKRNKMNE